MLLSLVVLLPALASARWLCSNFAPSDALRGRLSACRALDYAFCVDAAENERDVDRAAQTADERIAQQYVIATNNESQQCAYAWLAAACSDAFRRAPTPAELPCVRVCDAVRQQCTENFLFQCTTNNRCVDYLEGGALCALADADERDEAQPLPQAQAPRPPPAQQPFRRSSSAAISLGGTRALIVALFACVIARK